MARAYASAQHRDDRPDSQSDWAELRAELFALIDQVEGQAARTRHREPDEAGIAERIRDLRYQLAEPEPDLRHLQALRSVKRAVDRFSERDESLSSRPDVSAPNPRDTLDAAIQQIRARHGGPDDRSPRRTEPQFERFAQAVGGISGRLERLENELRGSVRTQTGNVKEIAEQVAQLSQVVELLAGAVGETGQVKRLEAQIAGVARLVAEGSGGDPGAVTRRLDELSAHVGRLVQRQHDDGIGTRLDDISSTVGRLADLQVQFADRVGNSERASASLGTELRATREGIKDEVGTVGIGLQKSMAAIEEAVRNVYDRIDAVERHDSIEPTAIERLTGELSQLTEAMKDPRQVETIIELVESIHKRIAELQGPQREVGELKLDMEALRATVAEAIEPRFAALEMQIESLNDRVTSAPSADISVSQLEAQVRQLVARMDQTGEQLTGLARLHDAPAEHEAPDYEALAELVALRTSEAVAQYAPQHPGGAVSLSEGGIEEIERRVSRLLANALQETPGAEVSAIEGSIREVNERLERLERALAEPNTAIRHATAQADPVAPKSGALHDAAPVAKAKDVPLSGDDPLAPLIAAASSDVDMPAQKAFERPAEMSADRDAMPTSPALDAPLRDRPFADQDGPIRAALEAKNGPRKLHPGLTYDPLPDQGLEIPAVHQSAFAPTTDRPDFDPVSIERPPRPKSSFDTAEPDSFDDTKTSEPAATAVESQAHAPSANTFIAAARRAAQRQQHDTEPSSGPGSLIARALATFQQSKEAAASARDDITPPEEKVRKPRGRIARLLAGDKEPRSGWKREPGEPALDDDAPAAAPAFEHTGEAVEPMAPAPAEAPTESLLSRYRRPILLAAALLAVALLTLNLVQQRLQPAPEAATPSESADDVSSAGDTISMLSPEPASSVGPAAGPRVIPIVDSLATASINGTAAQRFMPGSETPAMPMAFVPANEFSNGNGGAATEVASLAPLAESVEPLATDLAAPLTVELPPAGLGPEPLRRAAAQGDARAQFEVAAIYTEGRAVPEDLAAAAVWYERAAAQGFAPAQYRLGNLYENGRGVEKDLELARLWYQRAAEAGNRMAMHNLAALYAGGDLGEQVFESAAEWFEQAAIRGMRDSQFNLGMLHARGLGVQQNLADSYKWFSLAAARGDADAAKARDDVARSLDAETVSRLDDEIETFVIAPIDLGANFAPIGTWSPSFDPGEAITKTEVIMSVQAALGALGYDVGIPDGVAGPRTAQAIKAFETATGMSPSGVVNPRLLAVLGSQPV